MDTDFRKTDEFRSLRKGLIWVMSQQTPEGGWPNSPGQGPVTEVTGHVLNVLAEMDCMDCDAPKRAFGWLGEVHIKWGDTIRWGRDIMFREENLWAATMLCAASMLRSKSPLPFEKEALIQTLQEEIGLLTSRPRSKITRQLSCWTYLASAKASGVMEAANQKKVQKALWKSMKIWRLRGRSVWDSYQGETIKETAQVALALMCMAKRKEDQNRHIDSVMQFLIDHAQTTDNGKFWYEDPIGDPVGSRREHPFFSTRWCALALEEGFARGFSKPGQQEVVRAAVQWLMSLQSESDGRWQVPQDAPPGPSFCSYALLAIFKWLPIGYGVDAGELSEAVREELGNFKKQFPVRDYVKIYRRLALADRIQMHYPRPIAIRYQAFMDADGNRAKLSHLSTLYGVFVKYCVTVLEAFYCGKLPPADRDAKIVEWLFGKLKAIEPDYELKIIGQLTAVLSSTHDDAKSLRDIFSAYHTKIQPGRMIDCYNWLSADLLRIEMSQAVAGPTDLVHLLRALHLYFNKRLWEARALDEAGAGRHVRYIKAALEEALELFPQFMRNPVGIATDIRVVQENGREVFEHAIKLASGTDFYYTQFLRPNKVMDLKRPYLFRIEDGQWHPWFCLYPFAVFMRCEKCRQETVYFLDILAEERDGIENKQKGIYRNYSCGCPSKPDTIAQEIQGGLGHGGGRGHAEALYCIKYRERLTAGVVSQKDTELSALREALGLSPRQTEQLEADVRKQLTHQRHETIDAKTLEAFRQTVRLMRGSGGSLSDDMKMHLVGLGLQLGLPNNKVYDIIDTSH